MIKWETETITNPGEYYCHRLITSLIMKRIQSKNVDGMLQVVVHSALKSEGISCSGGRFLHGRILGLILTRNNQINIGHQLHCYWGGNVESHYYAV
jgi:hypothetical protein